MTWLAVRLFAGKLLGKLPPWLVYVLAAVLALCIALMWHHHAVHKAYLAGEAKADAKWAAAQQQAQIMQDSADHTNLSGQLAFNDKLEQNHANLETAGRDAVARYVASHRLPARSCSAAGGTAETSLHSDPGSLADGPAASVLVAVSADELGKSSAVEVQNTERGQFIRGLIEQGLGVPASEANPPPH